MMCVMLVREMNRKIKVKNRDRSKGSNIFSPVEVSVCCNNSSAYLWLFVKVKFIAVVYTSLPQ